MSLSLSTHECYSLLEKESYKRFHQFIYDKFGRYKTRPLSIINVESSLKINSCSSYHSRLVTSILFRFRLNALKTKFSRNINCICGSKLDLTHILFQCQHLLQYLPKSFINLSLSQNDFDKLLDNTVILAEIINCLIHSPVSQFL